MLLFVQPSSLVNHFQWDAALPQMQAFVRVRLCIQEHHELASNAADEQLGLDQASRSELDLQASCCRFQMRAPGDLKAAWQLWMHQLKDQRAQLWLTQSIQLSNLSYRQLHS